LGLERIPLIFVAHCDGYQLRHACGYYLAAQGNDTRVIQDYLGHKNIHHTVRYTQMSPNGLNPFGEIESSKGDNTANQHLKRLSFLSQVASIERTAYPRFKRYYTANELEEIYTPTKTEKGRELIINIRVVAK
jgi:hypothetical protein